MADNRYVSICVIHTMKTLRTWLVVIFSYLVILPAYADDYSVREKGGFFDSLKHIGTVLSRRISELSTDQFTQAGMGYAGKLTTPALMIAGSLSLIYLFYEALHYLANRSTAPLQIALDVGIPAILAAALISNYASRMSEFNALLDILRNIGGDPAGIIDNVVKLYSSVFELISICIANAFKAVGSEALSAFTSLGANSSVLLSIVDLIITLLFAMLIVALVLLGLAEIIGLLLMGPFLFAVGVAFGPIFLAGLVTPWTRDYTARWIGFIISAAVLTGIMGIIIGLSATVFNTLGFQSVTESATEMPTAGHLAIAAIVLMAVNSLIAQAPAIASAITPGTFGARNTAGSAVTAGADHMRNNVVNTARSTGQITRLTWSRINKHSSRQ